MFDVKKIAIYKVDYIIKVVTVGEQGSDRSFFTADARRLMRMDEKGDRYFTINFIPHFTRPVGAGDGLSVAEGFTQIFDTHRQII